MMCLLCQRRIERSKAASSLQEKVLKDARRSVGEYRGTIREREDCA